MLIAKLRGVIDTVSLDHIIIDVQGVGYGVICSQRTQNLVGPAGSTASLLIDTIMRENQITLYGFADVQEQQIFRLLNSVQGVSGRIALAILGVVPCEKILFAIAAGDKAVIQQADGVGPKLAARIVSELKEKTGGIVPAAPQVGLPTKQNVTGPQDATTSLHQDAVSALVNLGYSPSQAFAAVAKAMQSLQSDTDTPPGLDSLIPRALQEMA